MKAKLSETITRAKSCGLPERELHSAETRRRRVHNAIEDRKGQVRVFCRVRPLNAKECSQGDQSCCNVVDDMTLEVPSGTFSFDSVFAPSTQAEVFEDCVDLVQSAIDGNNVTIFAYGQTGAGKTHTMYGSGEDDGIAPRTITEVFEGIRSVSHRYAAEVSCTMMELYNNNLVDLLSSRDGVWKPPCSDTKLTVKVDKQGA